eukprot:g4194.t1
MCNATCGTFCFLTSIFGVLFLSIIAALIHNDYKYVGEWYDRDDGDHGMPTKEMRDNASKTLYATAGVYGAFAVLSLVCIFVGSRRKSPV